MKRLILDIDDTFSFNTKGSYAEARANLDVINRIKNYKNDGFEIVLFTARNMRTYEGNVGKINANMLPTLIEWLKEQDVPYDEIYTGKPWCGFEGFYIDDKAVRPREFVEKTYEEIQELLEKDKLEPNS